MRSGAALTSAFARIPTSSYRGGPLFDTSYAAERHEADPADAAAGERVELRVADGGLHHAHALRVRPELRDRIERAAVVVLVGVRLHDHDSRHPEPRLHPPVRLDRKVPGRLRPARRLRKARIVDVHVRVAGIRRRLEARTRCYAHLPFLFFLAARAFGPCAFTGARVGSPPSSARTKVPPW